MATLRFADRRLEVKNGETVLETLEAAGVDVPNSCRAGACQSCLMRAVSGEVPEKAQRGISPSKRELGYFLACVCRPTADLEIARTDASEVCTVTIDAIRRCAGEVLEIRLRIAKPLAYRGGQFVTLIRRDDGLARPYSLASPADAEQLELHVRHYPDGAMSGWLASASPGTELELRGPYGECFYVDDDLDRPLLLVGTGTGLAPLYGIVRDALAAGHRGSITLLHGALRSADLYHRDELAALAAGHENLEVVASALEVEAGVDSVDSTPIDALALDRAALSDHDALRVYVCGAPALVSGLRRRLFIAGVPLRAILADAFLPAAGA
ncbi:MAG: 2Fe-2S iron-sulfur cluster binding domain-containing protein [Myxococcales bacterium]|nr:2Fe-2S iron-sulfur cluster binding domain-containing protein [Myxococcales bacterium]MCB9754982.1 2Fe-2S iron-sulfur cluster binding domain-containing protein [Myxococcales bacterium]